MSALKKYVIQFCCADPIGFDDYRFMFECEAENVEHAFEQARNAYPEPENEIEEIDLGA